MKHIKLFESFDFTHSLETLVAQMVKELTPPTTNPKEIDDLISGFEELGINKKPMDLRIDLTDPLIPFLVWHNPEDSKEWRDSGYAEDYDGDFSNVNPLNVLAFVQIGGEYYAYKLTPEEKYYKEIISDEEEGMYDQDQLVKIENVDDLKRAFQESLWDMD
jgi:hypothetical protein